MLKKDAVEYFGGVKNLATALDVWPQTIYQWPDEVPDKFSYKLYVMTDGELKIEGESTSERAEQ